MIKKILAISFISALFLGIPTVATANSAMEIIDNEFQDISISVSESTLHISGANGEFANIYNLAGVCVMSFRVEGVDKRYELNLSKGCYIVKVGKVVRKISIR